MRVLWAVGFVLPQAAEIAGVQRTPFGGWIGAMLSLLANCEDVEIGLAMKAPVPRLMREEVDGSVYYLVPERGYMGLDADESDVLQVVKDFSPDLLQVEGTEKPFSLRFLRCWSGPNVLSLQGLLVGYEPFEYGRLPMCRMVLSGRPRTMLTAASLMVNKAIFFRRRLHTEAAALRAADNFFGRTLWDRAHAQAINPDARYFQCNRILRSQFYGRKWSIDGIQRHSIFIGNSYHPRKGVHFALQAVALLREDFPHIQLKIAGPSPLPASSRDWKRLIGYQAYLKRLVRNLGLARNVEFVGLQDASQMVERLEKTHVFVLSSLIENSPNSLGEAMIMGVPCVSAFAGGARDMAQDEKEALFYRPEDPVQLAFQIRRVFEDDSLAGSLSRNARERALKTHDPQRNLAQLLAAYRGILGAAG